MVFQKDLDLTKNLNIYCQSDGLLFQFILSEFLKAQKTVNEIEQVYLEIESRLIQDRLRANIEPYLQQFQIMSQILTGTPTAIFHELNFSWIKSAGSLKKLRHYCYLLSQKKRELEDVLNLNVCVSKAYHSVLQNREVVVSIEHQIADHKVPNYITLYQLLDKLIDNMRLASRLIMKILTHYKEDENILYFLIKHQKSFDEVYKTPFVLKVLKKMYPKGVKRAKDLIVEKYAKRGFDYLIAGISEEISKLQEENEESIS